MSEAAAENKMGTMPVGRLLVGMSTPMMLSMMVQALYNIVDSIFVAMVNEEALTAVSLVFSLQLLMVAFGVGTAVGVSALVARHLGEKDFERSNYVAANGIRLAYITAVGFLIFLNLVAQPFFSFQTDNELIVSYGVTYTRIIGIFCFGMFGQMMFERLLQSTGRTFLSMITQIVGAVTNIIMDPLLIFGVGPFPKLGVAGAATATIFGQILGGALAIYFNLHYNKELEISLKKYRFSKEIVKSIYTIGFPSIIMQGIGSVMTFFMNKILGTFSSTAVAVFGAYFKLQSFVLMPVFGLNNGLMPVIAYNFGARKPDRIKQAMKFAFIAAIIVLSCGTLLFQIVPGWLLAMFSASEHMMEIGIPALRIISIHFIFAAGSIICIATFQALGHGFIALCVSFVRQLVVLLPVAFLFSLTGNLASVWLSFPIAEIVAVSMCLLCLRRVMKKEIDPLYETEKSR